MPQLTYSIVPDGLVVPCLVGLDSSDMLALQNAGLPILPPLQLTGLIDTGSDVTCVDSRILRRLGLPIARQAKTTTAAGTIDVDLFSVSLSIAPADGTPQPLFTQPQLLVMELPHPIPPIDVIIGRDVILQGRLFVDGPRGTFSITFP